MNFKRTPYDQRKITFDGILERYDHDLNNVEEYPIFTEELIEAAGLSNTPIADEVQDMLHDAFYFSDSFRDEFEAMRFLSNALYLIEQLDNTQDESQAAAS